jgi:lambda family phage minor tail protein L
MGVTQTNLPENVARRLSTDAVIKLWELDYSVLAGNPPGTDIRRFVSDSDGEGLGVTLDGVVYDPLPMRVNGLEVGVEGAPKRPTVEFANPHGFMSTIIESIGGDLTGASVTLRRIFSRNLDDGDDPDPLAEWEPQVWRVERKLHENGISIEFELTAKADVEIDLPLRRMEHNFCPWIYKSDECGWVPGAGPYFDILGQSCAQEDDNCGLTANDCALRFLDRDEALRFGGFVGLERIIR